MRRKKENIEREECKFKKNNWKRKKTTEKKER